MLWVGSTEVFMKEGPVHQTVATFEGLEESDDAIPSSMVYAYAALREGIPFYAATSRRTSRPCRSWRRATDRRSPATT
jgi:myo-inositol-1-phosphate synthase